MRRILSIAAIAAVLSAIAYLFAPASAEAKGKCGGPCEEVTVTCESNGWGGNKVSVLTRGTNNGLKYQSNCMGGGTRSVKQAWQEQKPTKSFFTTEKPVKKAVVSAKVKKPLKTSTGGYSIDMSVKCGGKTRGGDVLIEFGHCPPGTGSATLAPLPQKTILAMLERGLAPIQSSKEKPGCYYFKQAAKLGDRHYKIGGWGRSGILTNSGGFSTSENTVAVGYGAPCAHSSFGTKYTKRIRSLDEALAIAGM